MTGARWPLPACALALALLAPIAAHADDPPPLAGPPLTLDEVLDSLLETHPDIERARRRQDAARGRRASARGVWDPVLAVRARTVPIAYYPNGQFDTMVRQATPAWGIGVFAGYRLGWGQYPIYKYDQRTLSAGEVRAGIDVPIWRDGPIDPRRAENRRAQALLDAAGCDARAAELSSARDAAVAYWRWVASGQEVRIQRELLEVATRRNEGMIQQAEFGVIPEILVLDNERLVLERQSRLIATERAFVQSSLDLSLHFRDHEQQPIRVPEGRVPERSPDVHPDALPIIERDVEDAWSARPELCALRARKAAAEVDVKLARNQRAPNVNAQAFAARDFGRGPEEFAPTEFGVGVIFEMPLALRTARGTLQATRAEMAALDAQLRGLADRIAAEVRQARVDLDTARQQVLLARRQIAAAEALADAERERFRQGASNLVIVNLRELAAADAARLEIEALADYHRAQANYRAARGLLPGR